MMRMMMMMMMMMMMVLKSSGQRRTQKLDARIETIALLAPRNNPSGIIPPGPFFVRRNPGCAGGTASGIFRRGMKNRSVKARHQETRRVVVPGRLNNS